MRVVVVGLDGLSPDIVRRLLDEGRLETFDRLASRGATGLLRSSRPMLSPALWTTLATGRPREEHGIVDFDVTDAHGARRLVRSTDRRTLALWNVASAMDRTTSWIGWWATWPAEPVRGTIVSDRVARTRYAEWLDGTRSAAATWPPDLLERVRPLVVDPGTPPLDEIGRIVAMTPSEREELETTTRPVFGHPWSVLKYAYCAQRTHERIALASLEWAPAPDLLGLFLVAADPIQHTFWHWFRPEDYPAVDRDDATRLGRAVPAIYEHDDRFLDDLLRAIERADARAGRARDTVVFLVSDHGFESSGVPPTTDRRFVAPSGGTSAGGSGGSDESDAGPVAVGQPGRHAIEGLLIASGGPIRRGVTVSAELVDLAPTVLALLGLPVPRDLPGEVLVEILDPAFLERFPVRRIESYEEIVRHPSTPDGSGRDGDEPSAPGEEALLRQLEALGYLDPAGGDETSPPEPRDDGKR